MTKPALFPEDCGNGMKTSILLITVYCFVSILSQASAHSATGQVVIHLSEQGFDPQQVEINIGDEVTFENVGSTDIWPASNIHPTHRSYPGTDIKDCSSDQKSSGFDACKGIKPGEIYSFTFNEAGEWRYHDHLHSNLVGTITVGGQKNEKPLIASITENSQGSLTSWWNTFISLFRTQTVQSEEPAAPSIAYNENITENATSLYESETDLYSYVKKFGPTQTTQQLHKLSATYGNCHDKAHEAGRFAYELKGEEAFQTCSAECHSGCYHGATEAYFRDHGTTDLSGKLSVICNSSLNPFFSHQCVHGVGHGLMAWFDYDIHQALNSCDLLPPASQQSCYSGVFMENVVGGLAEEHNSKFLSEDPHFPCNVVDKKYEGACYFYQTSRAITVLNRDFKKLAEFCEGAPPEYQSVCFSSMGRDVGGDAQSNIALAIHNCQFVPSGNFRMNCLLGAVQNYFWDPSGQDKAVEFCTKLTIADEKQACYSQIFARATQVIPSKDDLRLFCQKAEQKYQSECENEILNKYI